MESTEAFVRKFQETKKKDELNRAKQGSRNRSDRLPSKRH
ncbi:hypothetical protein J2Z83_002320 [Virgibacillus natechei]|uniref:DUF4023 domain-containing protein n=1 Tax=Virgibacillus natechei TaxID=1216297 RepID=A0ABS4IGW4_9BACI|nr:DUF4023 family protein [Virgibacillus natechei]MBP1970202.1 hypothetical protein [Virgibacillus natechei]UZD12847.1 DUF4023 family protein [Virgibacillus natechei]